MRIRIPNTGWQIHQMGYLKQVAARLVEYVVEGGDLAGRQDGEADVLLLQDAPQLLHALPPVSEHSFFLSVTFLCILLETA